MQTIDRIIVIGFGSIAQALLPLLVENFNSEIIIFDKEVEKVRRDIAEEYSAELNEVFVTPENFRATLSPLLNEKTFLLNLAVSVSSVALIGLSQQFKALYLDTCIEPWDYDDQDNKLTGNYHLRESLKKYAQSPEGIKTAIVAHGANPGFISILLKKALLEMPKANDVLDQPTTQREWAELAEKLELQIIQISECDTQATGQKSAPNKFVCTWSVDGLITECLQPSELGWGSHEEWLPLGAKKNKYALELHDPGRKVQIKSWSPNNLEFSAYLLTHNESLSIAEYLTISDGATLKYRPTVYYAYRPCDQTIECLHLLDSSTKTQISSKEIMKDDIISGIDELGIFLISKKYKSFWLGSNLSIGKARKMAKYNSATSLQVTSSIIAGMKWAEQYPEAGVLESENLDWKIIYDIAEKYWQPIITQETAWRPCDASEALSFRNFLISPQY